MSSSIFFQLVMDFSCSSARPTRPEEKFNIKSTNTHSAKNTKITESNVYPLLLLRARGKSEPLSVKSAGKADIPVGMCPPRDDGGGTAIGALAGGGPRKPLRGRTMGV